MKIRLLAIILISTISIISFSTIVVNHNIQTTFAATDNNTNKSINQLKSCIFEYNGAVYKYDENKGNITNFISSEKAICNPMVSPDGEKVAYNYKIGYSQIDDMKVCVYDSFTKTSKEFKLDNYYANAVIDIGWMDNHTLGVECHVNPSTSQFFVCDITSEKVIKTYFGSLFTVSPDGKHILYKENQPHFTNKFKPDRLCIDDQVVYESDNINNEITTYPLFSNTSRKIAFIEAKDNLKKVITANVDLSNKKISKISKVGLSNETYGNLVFDDNDVVSISNNDKKYEIDELNQNVISTKRTIDESIEKEKSTKIQRFNNAVVEKFKQDMNDDDSKILNHIKKVKWMSYDNF